MNAEIDPEYEVIPHVADYIGISLKVLQHVKDSNFPTENDLRAKAVAILSAYLGVEKANV